MHFEVIVSKGRIGDRTPGAIAGAVLLGKAVAERIGCQATECGTPEPPRIDNSDSALLDARANLDQLGSAVAAVLDRGNVPLVAGNKCPVGLATIPVAAARHTDLAVVWLDAHGDFHTPDTSESGYLGGMVLAAVCGLWHSGHGAGVDPKNVVLVGARDIDQPELELLTQAGVTVLSAEQGTPELLQQVIGKKPVWVHLDLDVLEPGTVGLDYEVPGGFNAEQLSALLGALASCNMVGAEVTELELTLGVGRTSPLDGIAMAARPGSDAGHSVQIAASLFMSLAVGL